MNSNWRRDYPVLVTDAQTLGAVAVIRSLGRAGYPVYSCAVREDALGFQSNYSIGHTTSPDYGSADFIDWVREYICKHEIRAIVPSEDFLLEIRPNFQEFSSLLPYSPSEQVVYAGMSKVEQILRFTRGPLAAQTASHIPPFLLVDDSSGRPLPENMESLGLPLYRKVDGYFGKGRNRGHVYRTVSLDDAESRLVQALAGYKKILVEGHVPGRGAGAFFLLITQYYT
ncbi:MAG: hypothetical protein ACT4O2_11595 [Beijerinckiaceae bacterium]